MPCHQPAEHFEHQRCTRQAAKVVSEHDLAVVMYQLGCPSGLRRLQTRYCLIPCTAASTSRGIQLHNKPLSVPYNFADIYVCIRYGLCVFCTPVAEIGLYATACIDRYTLIDAAHRAMPQHALHRHAVLKAHFQNLTSACDRLKRACVHFCSGVGCCSAAAALFGVLPGCHATSPRHEGVFLNGVACYILLDSVQDAVTCAPQLASTPCCCCCVPSMATLRFCRQAARSAQSRLRPDQNASKYASTLLSVPRYACSTTPFENAALRCVPARLQVAQRALPSW